MASTVLSIGVEDTPSAARELTDNVVTQQEKKYATATWAATNTAAVPYRAIGVAAASYPSSTIPTQREKKETTPDLKVDAATIVHEFAAVHDNRETDLARAGVTDKLTRTDDSSFLLPKSV
ncbi:hypothetical protein ACH5RR_009675 [Cinchona calisaya]|uniref:Late embryogenesis abundant protein n=1 Tax=Cinchona calisaya TaxID=153742 RepID=A0ABD3AFN9_9GENT